MSVSGNLATMELQELLQWVSQFRKKGALVIRNGSYQYQLYFEAGRIVAFASTDPAETLAAYLVKQGLVERETLRAAAETAKKNGSELGRTLVEEGALEEDAFRQALKERIERHVFEVLSWSEGDFRFIHDLESEKQYGRIEVDVTQLLLRGVQFIDEERHSKASAGESGDAFEDVLGAEAGSADQIAVEFDADDEPVMTVELTGSTPALPNRATPVQAVALVVGAVLLLAATWWLVPSRDDKKPAGTTSVAAQRDDLAEFGSAQEIGGGSLVSPLEVSGGNVPTEPSEAEIEAEIERLVAERTKAAEESIQSRYTERLVALERELKANKELAAKAANERRSATKNTRIAGPARRDGASDSAPKNGGANRRPSLGRVADPEDGAATAASRVDARSSQTKEIEVAAGAEITPDSPSAEESTELPEVIRAVPAERTPPSLTRPLKPRYPQRARALQKTAEVIVRVEVSDTGEVLSAKLVGDNVGYGFDDAALLAVRGSRWQAGTVDGEPTTMSTQLRVLFKP